MSQTFNDIDGLVNRLKVVARQIDTQSPSSEPPSYTWRHCLNELSEDAYKQDVLNLHHPCFEELFAPHLSDELFIDRAYQILMGRAADSGGMNHYLDLLPRAGRLYILAVLLCADEAQAYLARENVVIPRRGALTLPFRIAGKFGPLRRGVHVVLRPIYRMASIAIRPRLRLLARLSCLEVKEQRNGELIRDILIELDGETQRLLATLESQGAQLGSFEHELDQQKHILSEQERYQAALWSALQHHRRAVEKLASSESVVNTSEQSTQLSQDLIDAWYLAFEDACRGSEDAIAVHLRKYQPQLDIALAAGNKALDLGCGRGEWLALLTEQGFDPHGVDLNIAMIDHCQHAGFSVEQGDIIECLRRQPDNSHALVSGFHIAEHLPFDVFYTMVNEAHRILVPGGVLILETPNPENVLVGSHTFYHDPTHRNPLTPTAVTFMLRYHGFSSVEVLRFNPYPEEAKVPGDDPLTARVNGHLCGPQDFAAVGLKRAPVKEGEASDNEMMAKRADRALDDGEVSV
ncbi:methyltransferase domain-containing protein [Larsenimonas salina]|uniref:methyltransferase domain-containing protein n=1 Tax=Larsenimonas salina TaxID=1295565 RepID=UPI0020744882|nr:methyltransferase domain-containing protein [Larsenimonas salina]MCM5704929.1 methyltransferase domain-containing protein [Larsenimonas salina]